MAIQDAVLIAGKETKEKQEQAKSSSYKQVGGRLVTGVVRSGAKATPQFRVSTTMPKSSQVIKFISPPQKPQDLDEMEQLRRQVNIPRRPEPVQPLVMNSDLAISNSFELNRDTRRNKNDLGYGEEAIVEDIYSGLDFI